MRLSGNLDYKTIQGLSDLSQETRYIDMVSQDTLLVIRRALMPHIKDEEIVLFENKRYRVAVVETSIALEAIERLIFLSPLAY